MTSRQIVIATLELQTPERLAMSLPAPYPNDFCWGWTAPDPQHPGTDWTPRPDGSWEMVDEWGNTWARLESISKGEVATGALQRWEQLDGFSWPDYSLASRYEPARQQFAKNPGLFRLMGLPGFPFSIARYLRRMDQFLADVLLEENKVIELCARVEGIVADAIRGAAAAGADAVMFAEDWGTQTRLLVSPRTWRKIFQPGFERLCSLARRQRLYVFMHSCGYIREIIPDLIETGIDVFQLDQPQLMGVARLGREFGGKVAFWCPVDIQSTLQSRCAARIEADARLMVEVLGLRGRGGFIAGYYPSNAAIGLEPEWQDAACKAFVKYGTRTGV